MNELYEPLLERDAVRGRAAALRFRDEHGSDALFLAVARFAVLAYAPSQHAKHAVLACLAAHDLREDLGETFDDVMIECALYTAQSRQPWSEPPILDPPALEDDQRGDVDELRAAVAEGDRLRAERWLAKRLDDDDLPRDLFAVAADDFEDLGHKLIVSVAAWRLAAILGEKGRFAALRMATWELTASRGRRYDECGVALDASTLAARLIDNAVAEEGSIVSAHALFLLDAALEAGHVVTRVRDYLTAYTNDVRPQRELPPAPPIPPPYPLARDCAESLKAHALAKRMGGRCAGIDFARFVAAAHYNREHGMSLEDFSFA